MAIDLRSDTVTRPSQGMRDAIASAPVGDDVYSDDPTVNSLEERVAGMFGKEAGLFTPTGSLANQLAIRMLVNPGEELIAETNSHIVRAELGAAAGEDRLLAAAAPALAALRDATGESAQLYKRQGDQRICVAVAERLSGLRDSVPVGAALTMQAGSAAQILLAWEDSEKIHRGVANARFTAAQLAADRRRGWAQSVGEREAGVTSVSAPVRGPNGKVIAAVSISGPIERLGRQPGRVHAAAVVATAARLSEYLARE